MGGRARERLGGYNEENGVGGNCERASEELRGKREGEDNEKESRIRRKKGQKDKEEDSSLWISGLIASLLLLSERPHTGLLSTPSSSNCS